MRERLCTSVVQCPLDLDPACRGPRPLRIVREAMGHFSRHFPEPIRMAQTAFTIGVSQQWLDYSFDRVRGMTPAEALRSYRMNRLFVLLSRQPEQSLDCAIEACGLTGTPRVDALFENTFGIEMPMFLLTCRRAAGDRQEHRTTCLEVGQ